MKMVLKHQIAFFAVFITVLVTLISGLISKVHWLTLIQRTLVISVFFGMVGYVIGIIAQRYLQGYQKGSHIDIVSKEMDEGNEQPAASFNPFTTASFERITRK